MNTDTGHNLCTSKHPLPLGYFTSERSKGETGNHHLPFLQILWPVTAKTL